MNHKKNDTGAMTITPSRTLDGLIHQRLVGPVIYMGGDCFSGSRTVPAYTASIDAAVNLVSRVLPGWVWRLCSCHASDDAWIMPDMNHPVFGAVFQAIWPDVRDPLVEGPGIDLSCTPPGNPAFALTTALFSVLNGLEHNVRPKDSEGRAELQRLEDIEADDFGRRAVPLLNVAGLLATLRRNSSVVRPAPA